MKIEDYRKIFPFYIGCECVYPDTDGKATKATLTGFNIKEGIETTYKRKRNGVIGDIIGFKKNSTHNCYFDNIKLILRPLESMTEQEYYEMTNYPLNIPFEDFMQKVKRNRGFAWDCQQFKWLIDHYFDIFDLIKVEFAIKKEK